MRTAARTPDSGQDADGTSGFAGNDGTAGAGEDPAGDAGDESGADSSDNCLDTRLMDHRVVAVGPIGVTDKRGLVEPGEPEANGDAEIR